MAFKYAQRHRKMFAFPGLGLRSTVDSAASADLVVVPVTGAPSGGALPDGSTLHSGQQAIAVRVDASSVDALLYATVDGGTTWVPYITSGAGGTQTDLIFDASSELTISAGIVTATQGYHRIDTEADAASDDLDTISGIAEGEVVVIRAENAARTVVLKHNTGNIWCGGGVDVSLAEANDCAVLVGLPSSKVAVISFQTLASLPANLAASLASVANGEGASTIGLQDGPDDYTSTTVEGAFDELGDERPHLIADPGNGAAITVTKSGVCMLTSAGAGETRTLAVPSFVGQRMTIIHSVDGGDIAITAAARINQANNTIITMSDAADMVDLVGLKIGVNFRWQVTSNDGAVLS